MTATHGNGPPGPPAVLLVDDDDDGRLMLGWMFESHGFRVVGASTGADALRRAADRPDLVVLDVRLPDLSGFDVCRRLKADPATADTPVLLVSGVAVAPEDWVHGLNGGADAYLTKPVEPTVLIAQAQALLRVRKAEAGLRLRDRAIAAVLQGILVVELTAAGRPVVYASPGLERLTGFRSEDVVGRGWRVLAGPTTDPAAAARVDAAAADGHEVQVDTPLHRADGSTFWAAVSAAPVRDNGRVTHAVLVVADVTERRKLDEQYREAHKMDAIGRLAAGVAHDFNNLLTVVTGYAVLAEAVLPADHPARPMVAEMARAGERAADLTRRLLTFGRRAVVAPRAVDLNAVVADTQRMLGRLLGAGVELAVDLAPGLGPAWADPGQVEQVLVNLCLNARDAMPAGGTLTVATSEVGPADGGRPGGFVRLTVSDTGVGMPPDVAARVFEPFFTTKPPGQGTGLGLAIVHGIVTQAGGAVGLTTAPGQGATFRVDFPRADDAALAGVTTPPPATPTAPRGTETVLLVEDEEAVRVLARHVLTNAGYTVLPAADGNAALELVAAHPGPLDLVVTDVVMPGLGGRPLADRVRERFPAAAVVFISGYPDDGTVREGIVADRVDYLQKPFRPAALAAKVREVLDRRGGEVAR